MSKLCKGINWPDPHAIRAVRTHLDDPSETMRKAARSILRTSGPAVQLSWFFWMNWNSATWLVSSRTPTWVITRGGPRAWLDMRWRHEGN